MSFGAVAVGVGSAVAGAAVSSALAPSPSGGGSSGAAAADPFANERAQYQPMLLDLINNRPGILSGDPNYSFETSDPSYKWRQQQGIAGVNQGAANAGLLFSGQRGLDLATYASNLASTEYDKQFNRTQSEYGNQFNRLAQLSGANTGSPAAAGQLTANQTAQQQAGASAVGNAVKDQFGNIVNGVGGMFSGGSGVSAVEGGIPAYNFSSGVSDPSYGVSSGFFGV